MLLLCGGGCAGVYFFVLKPASDNLQALGSSRMAAFGTEPEEHGDGLSKQTINKVRAGMTQREVDAVLGGPGKASNRFATDEVLAGLPGGPGTAGERWHAATRNGQVFVWTKGADKVLVGFSGQPGAPGGTALGVMGLIDGVSTEFLTLPGTGGPNPNPGTTPTTPRPNPTLSTTPQPSAVTPDFTTTGEALAAEFDKDATAAAKKYQGKLIQVTGTLTQVDNKYGNFVYVRGTQPPATTKTITVEGIVAFGGSSANIKRLKVGDPVTFTCRYDKFTQPKANQPWELKLGDLKLMR